MIPRRGLRDAYEYANQQQQQPYDDAFAASANAPIPGVFNGRPIQQPDPNSLPPELRDTARRLAGSVLSQYMNNDYTPSDWRGLLPPAATPLQGPGPSSFQPSGPYGQQAMMMAGLLGQRRHIPAVPDKSYGQGPIPATPDGQGLLANPKRGPRMMYGK